tara:strand:+ start:448 stop:2052 length:1605 start_codon:yes stop_codon:yes gene_type:complete
MAENTTEQIQAQKTISELLSEIGKKAEAIQKTFKKQKDAAADVAGILAAQKTKMESFEKNRDAAAKVVATAQQKQIDLETEYMHAIRDGNLEQSYAIEERIKTSRVEVDNAKELNQIAQDGVDLARTKLEVQDKLKDRVQGQADSAKKLGDNINSFFSSLPGGSFLTKAFGIDKLGDDLEKGVIDNLDEVDKGSSALGTSMGGMFNGLTAGLSRLKAAFMANPILFLAGIALAITKAFFGFKKEVRDTANELEISAKASRDLTFELKKAEMQMKFQGFNADKLKSTLTAISQEFGTMEMITVENAKNIEMMAQEMGVAGTEVVKFNKVMMDLTGASFDVASNIAQSVADLAESEGVAIGRVMKDVSSNAELFAEFSMAGADGMAKAAVEAAKVGGSLSTILGSAEKLLSFESSISAQFKAQVLTGKMINTEKARQLALDGDIAGLTSEIQSIVGGVGDIQSLNVIQRKSVADAIGISVGDLLKISRGEQISSQETVQDKLNLTNKLLATGNDKRAEVYQATKSNKTINMNQTTY